VTVAVQDEELRLPERVQPVVTALGEPYRTLRRTSEPVGMFAPLITT
jgi:hypothetical protein